MPGMRGFLGGRIGIILAALPLTAAITAREGGELEWSRFRGPNGSGVSTAKNLPVNFGPDHGMLWRAALPPGNSSPVLAGDRIFVTAAERGRLMVLCLDRKTGRTLWRRSLPAKRSGPLQIPNSPASPTPATDGTNVYAFFQDFGLVSYGPDGKLRWKLPLGPFNNIYGMAASPIVAGDAVIVQCDQSVGSFLLAVDKDNGGVRWRRERPEVSNGYSTPILRETKAGLEVVTAGSFQLAAYRLDTGVKTWWVNGLAWQVKAVPVLHEGRIFINGWGSAETQPGRMPPKPKAFPEVLREMDANGDGRLSAAESPDERVKAWFAGIDRDGDGVIDASEWEFYRTVLGGDGGLLAVRAGGDGDESQRNLLWRYAKSVPEIASVLIYRGVLLLVNDGGVAMAFDPLSGKLLNRVRLKGAVDDYYASPVAGDGKIFVVSQRGVVTVLEAGSQLRVLAVNPLGEDCYATPALADGRVFVRTAKALYAFGDSAK